MGKREGVAGSCGGDRVVPGALRGVGEVDRGNKGARQGWLGPQG